MILMKITGLYLIINILVERTEYIYDSLVVASTGSQAIRSQAFTLLVKVSETVSL